MEIKFKHKIFKKGLNRQATTTKIEQSHHDLCDDIMWSNIHISGTPKRGKKLGQERTIKNNNYFFSNLMKRYQLTDPRKLTNVRQIKPHLR